MLQRTAGHRFFSVLSRRFPPPLNFIVRPSLDPMNLNQVTLGAIDVSASVAFYLKLGFELVVDAPHYARFKSKQGGATFSALGVRLQVHRLTGARRN